MTMADYIEQMRRMVPMTPAPQQYQPMPIMPQQPQQQQGLGIMPGLSLDMNLQAKRRPQDIKPQLQHDPLSPFWLQYNRQF